MFDSRTPEQNKDWIVDLQSKCTQLILVFVEPENGRYFAEIFKKEVVKRLNHIDNLNEKKRVLTTYLDNDDALNVRFVEDVQQRAKELSDGTFINCTEGYQFYTDHNYLMQIHYPRNHFVSVVESDDPADVKTIYGFGSHYYIDRIPGVTIEHVANCPLWCEVIHEKNMGNDAYFLWGTKMMWESNLLRRDFALEETVQSGVGLYFFRFMPRYIKTFIRRTKYYLFSRKW